VRRFLKQGWNREGRNSIALFEARNIAEAGARGPLLLKFARLTSDPLFAAFLMEKAVLTEQRAVSSMPSPVGKDYNVP
jgi:hypothetical protein